MVNVVDYLIFLTEVHHCGLGHTEHQRQIELRENF